MRWLPLQSLSEHSSVGCFGDERSAEYLKIKVVAFGVRVCGVLVVWLGLFFWCVWFC